MSGAQTAPASMLELWQAEWCPSSGRVRQRLTELGIDFIAHQVPAQREQREELYAISGQRTIPVLLLAAEPLCGEQAILAHLDARFAEPAGAEAHRQKAIAVKSKEMEESCRQAATPTR